MHKNTYVRIYPQDLKERIMELLNEWLPLIVTVLLSAITIGLYVIYLEVTDITDICREMRHGVQEVKVIND